MKAALLLCSYFICAQATIESKFNARPDPAECPCPKGTTSFNCSNKSWVQSPILKDWLQNCSDTLGALNLSNNQLKFMPFEISPEELDGEQQKDILENAVSGKIVLLHFFQKLTYLNTSGNLLDSNPPYQTDRPSIFQKIDETRTCVFSFDSSRTKNVYHGRVKIDLSNNKLTSMENIGGLRLQDFGTIFPTSYLNVAGNYISTLPGKGAFDTLSNLRQLDLQGNPIELDHALGFQYSVINQEFLPPRLSKVCKYDYIGDLSSSREELKQLEEFMDGKLPNILSEIIGQYITYEGVIYSESHTHELAHHEEHNKLCHSLAGRRYLGSRYLYTQGIPSSDSSGLN